jgi:hypothetical protein
MGPVPPLILLLHETQAKANLMEAVTGVQQSEKISLLKKKEK